MSYVSSLSAAYFTKLEIKNCKFRKSSWLPFVSGNWTALPSQDLTYSRRWGCLNYHAHHHRHNHGSATLWSLSSPSSSGRRGFHQQHQRTIQTWWDVFEEKKHGLPCISYFENNSKITTPGYNGNGLWELRAPPLSARVGLTGPNQDMLDISSRRLVITEWQHQTLPVPAAKTGE